MHQAAEYLGTDPDSAAVLANAAFDRASKTITPGDHADRAGCLALLAMVHMRDGANHTAAERFAEALAMMRRLFDHRDDPELEAAIETMALLLRRDDRDREAEPLYVEALAMQQRMKGDEADPNVVETMTALAHFYEEQGLYRQAEPLYVRKLELIRRMSRGRDGENVATAIFELADLYREEDCPQEAEPLYVEAMVMRRRLSARRDYPGLATSINSMGRLLADQQRYQDAIVFLVEALRMRIALSDKHDRVDVAISMNNVGFVYEKLGRHTEAEQMYGNAVAMYRRLSHGEDRLDLAVCIDNMAQYLFDHGRFQEAVLLYNDVVNMRRHLYTNRDRPELARSISNLASLRSELGEYDTVEALFVEALHMNRRLHPTEDHADLATSLNQLGVFYYEMGRYAEADQLLADALEMRRRLVGHDDDLGLAESLNNAAAFENARGRPREAEPLSLESLAIYRRLYATREHPDLATAISRMAEVYEGLGKRHDAETLKAEALEMRRRLFEGNDHPDLAGSMVDVALRAAQSDMCATIESERAAAQFAEASAMYRRLYAGRDHPDLAACLNDAALLSFYCGDYSKSQSLFDEALRMTRRLYRDGRSIHLASCVGNVATLYDRLGLVDSASKLYGEWLDLLANQYKASARFENEREQLLFVRRFQYTQDRIASFCARRSRDSGNSSELMANLVLGSKGVVLENVIAQQRALARVIARDSTTYRTWQRWRGVQMVLSHRSERTPKDTALYQQWLVNIEALEREAGILEKLLARRLSTMRDAKIPARWQDVASILEDDQAVVELIQFRNFNVERSTDSILYYAVVLRRGYDKPALVPLCEQRAVQAILDYQVDDPTTDSRSYVHDAARRRLLYQLVWQPVEALLGGARRIYVSPDGVLNRVAFGLLADSTDTILQNRYNLQYVFTGRDLIHDPSDTARSHDHSITAAVIGNPRYDADSALLASEIVHLSAVVNDTTSIGAYIAASRPSIRRDAVLGVHLRALPGTESEVGRVSAFLVRHAFQAITFTDVKATEEAFMKINAPTVLHVATHGFFFSEPIRSTEEPARLQAMTGARAIQYADNPLLRSGLLLAGADHAWTLHPPYEGISDGIVTAYDVAHMDLTGTELVVLSACETGLGDLMVGEGVMGLKRAFRAAGAKAVMMSLWKVPDKQTRELMELFYTNWLDGNMEKARALAEAQREMARSYDDPYFWGAFVLVGE